MIGALALAVAGCASRPIVYPGTEYVAPGERPLVRIEPDGSTYASPRELHVPLGVPVVWRNVTTDLTFVRFTDPIPQLCGAPLRFAPGPDGGSFASSYLPPFGEAGLCIGRPGRYDYVVSILGRDGGGSLLDEPGEGLSPVKYGTIVVE